MSESNWELWGIIIAIIEFDINYYIYSETGSIINVLVVLVASIIFALAFVLSHIYAKIKEIEIAQEDINKRLIRDKELEDIRLDLRDIKRKVLK